MYPSGSRIPSVSVVDQRRRFLNGVKAVPICTPESLIFAGTLTVMSIGEYAVFAGALLKYDPLAFIVSMNGTMVVIGGSG